VEERGKGGGTETATQKEMETQRDAGTEITGDDGSGGDSGR
jgi:hypothetical protein